MSLENDIRKSVQEELDSFKNNNKYCVRIYDKDNHFIQSVNCSFIPFVGLTLKVKYDYGNKRKKYDHNTIITGKIINIEYEIHENYTYSDNDNEFNVTIDVTETKKDVTWY